MIGRLHGSSDSPMWKRGWRSFSSWITRRPRRCSSAAVVDPGWAAADDEHVAIVTNRPHRHALSPCSIRYGRYVTVAPRFTPRESSALPSCPQPCPFRLRLRIRARRSRRGAMVILRLCRRRRGRIRERTRLARRARCVHARSACALAGLRRRSVVAMRDLAVAALGIAALAIAGHGDIALDFMPVMVNAALSRRCSRERSRRAASR